MAPVTAAAVTEMVTQKGEAKPARQHCSSLGPFCLFLACPLERGAHLEGVPPACCKSSLEMSSQTSPEVCLQADSKSHQGGDQN